MRYFFMVETIPYMYELFWNTVQIFSKNLLSPQTYFFFQTLDLIFLIIIYPLMQAFGMLYLKDSKDALQGISILNLIMIISKNQKIQPGFQEVIEDGLEYKQLDEEQ